jgi:hypothetical protein
VDIPKITLTMLGVQHCGKTALLHGMYAVLSAGVRGYFLYTEDPDDDITLSEAWELLREEGQFPPPTDEVPIRYDFVFKYGLEPLMRVNFVDFRGGAMVARANAPDSPEDVAELRARLKESDSIYLVLDGNHVGEWIKQGCPSYAGSKMKVAQLSRYINDAVTDRIQAGRPTPSVVVIISKADVLPEITGLSKGKAFDTALENLQNLVPVVFLEGVTAMLCPVQLGNFGVGAGDEVDPAAMDPRFLHKPLIFSLMHYLTEQIRFERHHLVEANAEKTAAEMELAQLRSGFMANWFRRSAIENAAARIDESMSRSESLSRSLSTAQERAEQLMRELEELPIIKDGEVTA